MTSIISEKDLFFFYIRKGFISKVLYAEESSKKYSKVLVFNISPVVSKKTSVPEMIFHLGDYPEGPFIRDL